MTRKLVNRSLCFVIAVLQTLSIFVNITAFASENSNSLGDYDKSINFGVANNFNIFLFGDHKQSSVDAGGRVAVGGNAIYNNYSIGNKLDKSTSRADLIIGGNADVSSGMNFSGKTIISSTSKVINYSMINSNVSPAKSIYSTEDLIDFTSEKQNLIADSKYWSSLPVNGTVKVQHGQLTLEGTDSELNVFSFDGTNIEGSGISMLNLNGINIIVPDNSTVLINIKGDNIGFGSYSIFSSGKETSIEKKKKFVWNFYEAKSLKSMGLSIAGSVLAPQADWRVIGSGNIEGNLIANSLKNEGGTLEAHEYLFNGLLPKNPRNRVLLISIDGLHSSDLASYIIDNPKSALAFLSNRGITYENPTSSKPSDSFPGLMALVTGGSPNSTGVFYHDTYDRKLLPPKAAKSDENGTEVVYDESIDKDMNAIDGGGGINPDLLPRDPNTKQPVYPHQFLQVNTAFEAVKANRCRTAWIDENLACEIVTGPSGKGVDDLYTPEIASDNRNNFKNIKNIKEFDDLKVDALINQIDGFDHTRTTHTSVPTLFGMTFQAVNVGQMLSGNGYEDAKGTLSNGLKDALDHTDDSLNRIVEELRKEKLLDSTIIIISAKHGQSPIDPDKTKIVDPKTILDGVTSDKIVKMTVDDVALIWLSDQSKTDSVISTINNNKNEAEIKEVYSYSSKNPKWPFNDPSKDSRVPDIIIQPNDGVIYSANDTEIADHGGFTKDDTNVALLVSYSGITSPRKNISPVDTAQVAPTILKFLEMDPNELQAVKKENTKVLPGIFLTDINAAIEAIKSETSNPWLYEKTATLYARNKESGYKIFLDGNLIDFSRYNNVEPVIVNERTLVPLAAIAESLGASVKWDESARLITLTSKNTVIKLTLDSDTAYLNGESLTLDVPAKSINGRALIPLSFVSKSFGKKVGWDPCENVKVISIYE